MPLWGEQTGMFHTREGPGLVGQGGADTGLQLELVGGAKIVPELQRTEI